MHEDSERAALRSHGKPDMPDLLDSMLRLTCSIPNDIAHEGLQGVRLAIAANAGALEHWVSLEKDPAVLEAVALDELYGGGGDIDEE